MTEKQGRKRTFGELERRRSQQAGAVTGWRASLQIGRAHV